VSRFAAYAIDLTASTAMFSLALAAISYAVHIVTGHEPPASASSPARPSSLRRPRLTRPG
jgi:hypothetical protein